MNAGASVSGARSPATVASLARGDRAAARRVLTDAFLDDPAWIAIGPTLRPWRRAVMHLFFAGEIRVETRYGATVRGATRDGALVGFVSAFDADDYPPPSLASTLHSLPAFVLSGPGPTIRGLALLEVFAKHHPTEPHVYVDFLAVDPGQQRSGVGRTLMRAVFDDAFARELPVYLETTKPENVPYYTSLGFRVVAEDELPRDSHVWFMWRDPAPG